MSYPIDRFAAFLAHQLNQGAGGVVRPDLGRLHAVAGEALAGRYAGPLLHQPAYAWRMGAEEAAARWLEAALERRLLLSGRAERSAAHRLLEALCRRGRGAGWAGAAVARAAAAEGGVPPPGWPAVASALARLPEDLSPGNAAATLRARGGPLRLAAGGAAATVAEEISLWDALGCAPPEMVRLAPGPAFDGFCAVMIDALRTAHRPVQELLALGRLCPFDWLAVLAVNQVRALRRFLAALPAAPAAATPAEWGTAWAVAPVAGFRNATALWEHDIGRALRQPVAPPLSFEALQEAGVGVAEEAADEPPALLQPEALDRRLRRLEERGVLAEAERRFLLALAEGASCREAAAEPELRLLLRGRRLGLPAYLEELHARVMEGARRLEREEEHDLV